MMPRWFHRTLYSGDQGSDVALVQRKLGASITKTMDDSTVALVRGFQRQRSLPITGVVDHPTAVELGESATYGLVPQWYQPTLDEVGLRDALHIRGFVSLDDAIRRFQSAHGHYPDGLMTEALAIEIGD
jgi:peptidoglycan hydrolase-like protein with peptidoglycan-binding domain